MPHQSHSGAKTNTQGGHYTPKTPAHTIQLFDPTRTAFTQNRKTIPQLRKLG
jgi:hypothetical protein